MNSTAQWSIMWDIALLPPQEMLPIEFCKVPCDNTASTNSTHLFGFAPCSIPLLPWENSTSMSQEQAMVDTRSDDDTYVINQDFSALFTLEEFAPFI